MTVIKSFILIIFLMTSGLLPCTCHTCLHPEKKLKLRRMRRNRAIALPERPSRSRAIGIHLGASYSSVAVYKHPAALYMKYCRPPSRDCDASSFYDTMEVVVTMPSCVSFTDSGVLIGELAKAQEVVNSERTICGINRLIGKRFHDPEFQSYVTTLPYKVVDKENEPHIEVHFKKGEIKLFSPKELCAMILGKLKEIAEAYMERNVRLAVIFLHHQSSYVGSEVQQQMSEACGIAGLKTCYTGLPYNAVSLSHLCGRRNFTALVYDLGSSAFGATIVDHTVSTTIERDTYSVLSFKGDANLGGQVFDTRLVDYLVNLIKSKYKKDIGKDLNGARKLRTECEKAKISLSSNARVMIKIEFTLVDDESLLFEEPITRLMFEELNMDLFNKTMDLVKGALEEGKLKKTDIDEIILVGRSTEIPMIQHLVKNYFEKEPLNVVNPKEALAFAATQATGGFLKYAEPHSWKAEISSILVPKFSSVGIETIGGVMTIFTNVFPSINLRDVTTYYDGQTTIEIKVFEGPRVPFTKYCHYLGSLQITNLPPAPRGETTIEVIVEVYADESIRVTAEHEATQNMKSIIISDEERYNNDERIVREYDWDYMDNFKDNRDDYIEDKRMSENVIYAMSVLQPQPHSMGFAAVNTWDSLRFQPQSKWMCKL